MYEYRALVTRVYDGDTVTVDIDLGFGVSLKSQKIRLSRINTPEIRGSERQAGLVARNALREKICGRWVILRTKKDKKGKYGRWLGELWLADLSINEWMLSEGYAKKYM